MTGDSHVHMIHGEKTIAIDFPYAALSARAEGLDYMALAQQWNLPRVTPEDLDTACRRVSTPDFLLTWNLEAPKNFCSATFRIAPGTDGPSACGAGPAMDGTP